MSVAGLLKQSQYLTKLTPVPAVAVAIELRNMRTTV